MEVMRRHPDTSWEPVPIPCRRTDRPSDSTFEEPSAKEKRGERKHRQQNVSAELRTFEHTNC